MMSVASSASELVVPADPFAQAAAHDVLELATLQPWQFLGEKGDALTPAAWHAGDVGAPEEALRPERVEDAVQAVLDVPERIGLRRVMRRAGRLQRHVGELGKRTELVEVDERFRILAVAVEPAVIRSEER